MTSKMKWPDSCNVKWIHDTRHGYMTCDIGTWLVIWIPDLWHGYMTCDRSVLTKGRLKLGNDLGLLEIYIRNIWVARYFTYFTCVMTFDIWYMYDMWQWNDISCE